LRVSRALSTLQKMIWFCLYLQISKSTTIPLLIKRLHGELHEKHTQNIYHGIGIPCWTYNMSLGRSRVHMGKGITRLCRDLNHLQRTRAETGPRQWLKTRCYDLTLTLVAFDIDVLICWLIWLIMVNYWCFG
jgi:hypothetical protein